MFIDEGSTLPSSAPICLKKQYSSNPNSEPALGVLFE